MLTAAEPNLAYFQDLIGYDRVEIDDVSELYGSLAIQGPRAHAVLSGLAPEVSGLDFFDHTPAKIGNVPVTISRTGFTGDLGFEVFCDAGDANEVWDLVFEAGAPHGMIPFGQIALLMARIDRVQREGKPAFRHLG